MPQSPGSPGGISFRLSRAEFEDGPDKLKLIPQGAQYLPETEALQAGAECRLRNPWGEAAVTLHRDGKKSESLKGSLLKFTTRQGERIVVVPSGASLPARHSVPGGFVAGIVQK
jgi:hypothetical protein